MTERTYSREEVLAIHEAFQQYKKYELVFGINVPPLMDNKHKEQLHDFQRFIKRYPEFFDETQRRNIADLVNRFPLENKSILAGMRCGLYFRS